jgi:hypothetical protein
VFPTDAKVILDSLGSKRKSLEIIPGAHYFEDSREVREHAVSLVCDWVRAHV